jgi:hypothetical protein
MSKKNNIGLQNRLEIVIQAILDYETEGGLVDFAVLDNRLMVQIERVVENDGRLWVQADTVSGESAATV